MLYLIPCSVRGLSHLADLALRLSPTLKSGVIRRNPKKKTESIGINRYEGDAGRERSGVITDHFGLFKIGVSNREHTWGVIGAELGPNKVVS